MRVIAKIVYGFIIFLLWIVSIFVGAVVDRIIIAIIFEQRLTLNLYLKTSLSQF